MKPVPYILHNSSSLGFLITIAIGVFVQTSVAVHELDHFPPEETAKNTAKRILKRFEPFCGEPCIVNWDCPSTEPAVAALTLLGWPAASVILDTGQEFPECSCVGRICSFALQRLKFGVDLGGFYPKNIRRLKQVFTTPPPFPSDEDLSRIEPLREFQKIVRDTGMVATPDAHRVLVRYLSYLDRFLQSRAPHGYDVAGPLMPVLTKYSSPIPAAVPGLVKLALGADRVAKLRLSDETREKFRYNVIDVLADTTRKTTTGLIHIAMIEDAPKYSANYIEIATSHVADIDVKLVETLLYPTAGGDIASIVSRLTEGADRVDIALAIGKSGDRAWRRVLLPLLEDSDKGVRYAAATGLAYLGDDSGMELIRKHLNDPIDEFARQSIVRALGKLGTDEACELLCEQLTIHIKTNEGIRPDNVFQAMRDACNSSLLVGRLFNAGTDSGQLHKYLAEAIRAVADIESVPILAKHLDDKDDEGTTLAAELIIKLMKIELKENDDPVRTARAWWKQHQVK